MSKPALSRKAPPRMRKGRALKRPLAGNPPKPKAARQGRLTILVNEKGAAAPLIGWGRCHFRLKETQRYTRSYPLTRHPSRPDSAHFGMGS